jgi:hypothetical protein
MATRFEEPRAPDTPDTMPRTRDRSVGTLFSDLANEASTLIRKEVDLAKMEVSEKVDRVQRAATSLAAGGAILYAGLLVLLFAVVAGLDALLDRWWPTQWLAPLIVGLVVLGIGYAMLRNGLNNMKADSLIPRRTMRSLRRDAEFAREQVRERETIHRETETMHGDVVREDTRERHIPEQVR